MKETVELSVSREGLQAGDYNCTLIVRSDLRFGNTCYDESERVRIRNWKSVQGNRFQDRI